MDNNKDNKKTKFTIFSFRIDEATATKLSELAARDERKRGDWLKLMIRREAAKLPQKTP